MKNSIIKSLRSQATSAKVATDGFPWLLATVLYTFSWGWSLLRPNTLYWDDWAYIYDKPKSYLNQIFVDTGLPPWRALIDQELIAIGYWTIPVLTFLFFFASGMALYFVLKSVHFLEQAQISLVVLIFLLAPVNHARIALVMFGYTTSYFLFFVAWAILVRHKKMSSFLLAVVLFFWSFMTHSFLFFYLLPLAHFVWNHFENFRLPDWKNVFFGKVFLLFTLPCVYYVLRRIYWPPTETYEKYHQLTFDGLRHGLIFLFAGATIFFLVFQFALSRGEHKGTRNAVIIAWGIYAWGLLPYFVNQSLVNTVSVFAFRADYGTRHSLLTPLGIGLIVASFAMVVPVFVRQPLTRVLMVIFTVINIFFATQYLLDSFKKEQLTELFQGTEIINSDTDLIFVDDTKLFNGRFSTYRNTELLGLIELASKSVKSISGKTTCEDVSDGYELRLKSNKNFYSALVNRNLGLYFEISKC